ncbi:MAG: nucleotidyl transferase AbiEii/AbiGii toxin family protein, partial [Pyrinomonadaceae bacterium]
MTTEPPAIRIHEDIDLFREAVNLTAAETKFAARLIEKDYFCTVLLAHFGTTVGEELVFKGGTCLAKVHADFYRLSEDLDFVISVATDASRAERRKRVEPVKTAFEALANSLKGVSVVEALIGANNSTQYIGALAYDSVLSSDPGTIKIEVSLREPLLIPTVNENARTILIDPISHEPMVPPLPVRCISKVEAFAEKFRAALTRREPAIRDFYDIDYAVRKLALDPRDENMVQLVRQKLTVPGNEAVDVSDARLGKLRQQVEPELKPVLRESDFQEFDLERAFRAVAEVANHK